MAAPLKRVIKDYNTLTKEHIDLINEHYPNGFENENLVSFVTPKGQFIKALEVRTDDTIYLFKIDKNMKVDDEENQDNEDNGEFLQIEKNFDHDFKREAAIKIQALQRGHKTRKDYAKNFQEKNSAATTIVKNFRRYIAQRNFVNRQESAKKEDSAANIINSYFKKYVTKIKEERERQKIEKQERERQKSEERERQNSKETEELDIWTKKLHQFLKDVNENKEKHPIDVRSVSAPPRRPDENIVPNTERAVFK
jgi:hypothetical protein